MKVAQIQFAPRLGDCECNQNLIQRYFDSIDNVDLIVLPELSNSGYEFKTYEYAMEVANQTANANFVSFLIENAKQKNCHIISGYLEKDGDLLYNSSVIVSPNGEVGNFRKMHLFMNEKNIFTPGNLGLPVFNIGDIRVGMVICFDYLFPEIWRILALKQANIVVHPSNLLTQNAYIAVPGQALMNGYFVITSNRIGTEDDLTFCGKSFIVNPRGKVISSMGETEDGIKITEFNPLESRDKMITSGNHIINDRRPDQYGDIIN